MRLSSLDLRLPAATQPDTPFLTVQVCPAAHQARSRVFKLGKLDLQLALEGTGALGENIEYQFRACHHATAHHPFEVALLGRCKLLVDQDQVRRVAGHCRAHFLRLAFAHQEPRVPVPAPGENVQDDIDPRGPGQFAELARIEALGAPKLDVQEYGVAPGRETIEKQARFPLPQPGG